MVLLGKTVTRKLALESLAILALVLTVGGILTYLGLIWREKQQFDQAEKEIDALYAQIVEKVGKPDQEKKEKSCDKPNLKYERGPLSCSVGQHMLFDNKDYIQANNIKTSVSLLSNSPLRPGSATTLGKLAFEMPDRTNSQVFFQTISLGPGTSCALAYDFAAEKQDNFELTGKSGLEVSVSCSRSALLEYFPVKD